MEVKWVEVERVDVEWVEVERVEVEWMDVEQVEVERVDIGLFLAISSCDVSHNSAVTSTHSNPCRS